MPSTPDALQFQLSGQGAKSIYLGQDLVWPRAHFNLVSDIAPYLYPLDSVPDDYEWDVVNDEQYIYSRAIPVACSDGSGYVVGISQIDRKDAITRNGRIRLRFIKFTHESERVWEINWSHAFSAYVLGIEGFIELEDGRLCALLSDRRNSVAPYFYDLNIAVCDADGTNPTVYRIGHNSISDSENQGIVHIQGFCEDNSRNIWLFTSRGWPESGYPANAHYQKRYIIKLNTNFQVLFTKELTASSLDQIQWTSSWPRLAVAPGNGSSGIFILVSLQKNSTLDQNWMGGLRVLRIDDSGNIVWHKIIGQLTGNHGSLASDPDGNVLIFAENFGEAYSNYTYDGDNLGIVKLNGSTGELISSSGIKSEMLPYGGWWNFGGPTAYDSGGPTAYDSVGATYTALVPWYLATFEDGRIALIASTYGGANYWTETLLLTVISPSDTPGSDIKWSVDTSYEFSTYAGRKHGPDYLWWNVDDSYVSLSSTHFVLASVGFTGWTHVPMNYIDHNVNEAIVFCAQNSSLINGNLEGTYGRDPKWITQASPEIYNRTDITSVTATDLSIVTTNQIGEIAGVNALTPEAGIETPNIKMTKNGLHSGAGAHNIVVDNIVYTQNYFDPLASPGRLPVSREIMQNGITNEPFGVIVDTGYELPGGEYVDALWIQMDFGSVSRVRSIYIAGDFNGTINGEGYESEWNANWHSLEYSLDGIEWYYLTDVGRMIDGVKHITGFDIRARYLRIRGSESMFNLAISEFYATSDVTFDPILPQVE